VECLHRLGSVQGIPAVRVVQDVVEGKTGWLLEVGSERYWLRPQVDVGPDGGVSVASRPDFVISPAHAHLPRRAVAVFADGWSYHEDRLRDDARKRSALVASGRYWVWSITWDDVQHALAGSVEGGVAIPGLHQREAAHGVADAVGRALRVTRPASAENAVAILLRWLAAPGTSTSPVLDGRQRVAASILATLTISPDSNEKPRVDGALREIARVLPDGCADIQPSCADAQSHDPTGACVVIASWPRSFMEAHFEGGFGAVQLCASRAQDKTALKEAWRQWLAWFNCLQWLPNFFLVEEEGALHGDYANLGGHSIRAPASDPSNAAWSDAIASALASVREGLQHLRGLNLPPPDQVGFEYAQDGQIVAEAELAWEAAHVVVLTEDQWAQRQIWHESGWQAVAGAESQWYEPVAQLLREQA
jgi:DEAD/DEAH box helicase domain-containing protein